jgi:ABC-2 type transport system permease protein
MLLYSYEYYYYYQQRYAVALDCEGQLTSAVVYVVGDATDTVYTLSGHNEESLPENIASLVEKSNLATGSVDLLVDGQIPDDCGTIVCYNPTADLSDDELTMLRDFMSQGGDVILVLDQTDLKNFNTLLSENGLEMLDGYVGDQSRYYTSYASYYGYYCFAPVVSSSSDITSPYTQMNAMALYSRGMMQSDELPDNISVTNLMTTSSSGIHYIEEDVYETGQYIIGADAANSDTGAHLIVFTSYYMFGDDIAGAFASLSNSNILLGAITSGFDGVESVNIGSRSLDIGYNTIKNPFPWIVLFVIALPAAFIICGFVTWNRRRKQ